VNTKLFIDEIKKGLFAHPWPDASIDQNAAMKCRFLLVIGAVPLNKLPDFDSASQQLYRQV
jgi:hypothetical protein